MLQFTNRIKQFLAGKDVADDQKRYLFIQADQSQEHGSDVIACARHTVVESFKETLNKQANNTFIVLLINLPKENVEKFVGFQFSHWSCYHLDEIEDNPPDLPVFERMPNRILSQLLADSLDDVDQQMSSMDLDGMNRATSSLNMSFLMKKLAHNACSLITDVNLARTINRIDVFIQLCDDATFVQVLGKRLTQLQRDKEEWISGFNQGWWDLLLFKSQHANIEKRALSVLYTGWVWKACATVNLNENKATLFRFKFFSNCLQCELRRSQ